MCWKWGKIAQLCCERQTSTFARVKSYCNLQWNPKCPSFQFLCASAFGQLADRINRKYKIRILQRGWWENVDVGILHDQQAHQMVLHLLFHHLISSQSDFITIFINFFLVVKKVVWVEKKMTVCCVLILLLLPLY